MYTLHPSCVHLLCWSLKHSVKWIWTGSAFSANESAWSVLVAGNQSHVWSGQLFQTPSDYTKILYLVPHGFLYHCVFCFFFSSQWHIIGMRTTSLMGLNACDHCILRSLIGWKDRDRPSSLHTWCHIKCHVGFSSVWISLAFHAPKVQCKVTWTASVFLTNVICI